MHYGCDGCHNTQKNARGIAHDEGPVSARLEEAVKSPSGAIDAGHNGQNDRTRLAAQIHHDLVNVRKVHTQGHD